MPYVNKTQRVRLDAQKASQKLAELTGDIILLEYGGKVTSRSKFYNKITGLEFYTTLNCVRKRLKKGDSLTALGARQKPQKIVRPRRAVLEEALRHWLQQHLPHVELLELGDTYGDPAKFRRRDTGTLHSLSPNRLKDKLRSGLQVFPTQGEICAKREKTRKANGQTFVVNNKTLKEYAEELGVGYSTFQSALKHHGIDRALALSANRPITERVVENLLTELSVPFVCNKKVPNTSYRPDFVLPDHGLIIECDGLYWHSELFRDKNYHFDKRNELVKLGYKFLAFREHELCNYEDIVRSMITHRLGRLTDRVYARKCQLTQDRAAIRQFLDNNHLMGSGAGTCLALTYEDIIVAAVQVKRHKKGHELSRFCTAKEISVVGGFSRLLKHVQQQENIKVLRSFVDLRYGTGTYLVDQGFKLTNDPKPSFSWTQNKSVVNRLRYTDREARMGGWHKLWDYGQALYEKQYDGSC